VTVGSSTGVTYVVSGDKHTVTATLGSGYAFPGTLPDGWVLNQDGTASFATHLVSAGDCLADANPVTLTATQGVCPTSGTTPSAPTLILPNTPNVTYSVAAGPYTAGSTVTVTATAANGYEFTASELPTGWTLVGDEGDTEGPSATVELTFPAAPGCAVATAPTFTANVCVSGVPAGASFTLPSVTGMDYYVDGTKTAAGKYSAKDAAVVAITAEAQKGFTLKGPASWSNTFGATPVCLGVDAAVAAGPPAYVAPPKAPTLGVGALASTGVPTAYLLLFGGLLILGGTAMFVGGFTFRRPGRR
jgi:hypothetical protein